MKLRKIQGERLHFIYTATAFGACGASNLDEDVQDVNESRRATAFQLPHRDTLVVSEYAAQKHSLARTL